MYFIALIVIAAIIIGVITGNGEAKQREDLKNKYYQLLKGNDRRAALEAGRAYYSSLRKHKELTIYDEQAITNDMSTMSAV